MYLIFAKYALSTGYTTWTKCDFFSRWTGGVCQNNPKKYVRFGQHRHLISKAIVWICPSCLFYCGRRIKTVKGLNGHVRKLTAVLFFHQSLVIEHHCHCHVFNMRQMQVFNLISNCIFTYIKQTRMWLFNTTNKNSTVYEIRVVLFLLL